MAIITLDRPEKRKALSLAVMRELHAIPSLVSEDRAVRVVVLRGEGPAFSAGHECQLVASCDLAVASGAARFATPGVKIGLFCSTWAW